MNETEQGVRPQSKLAHLLVRLFLLSTFCLTHHVSAQTAATEIPAHESPAKKHHAYIIYSPDNSLHSNIVTKLSKNLQLRHPDIIISETTPQKRANIDNADSDIIIGIGRAGMQSANQHYPETKKLFIATDPNQHRLKINKGDAVLYMTQSYCRQIKFIRQLSAHWKTISVLSSEKKPVDNQPIQQCAEKHDFKIYKVNTTAKENLTNKIKDALKNSDVLLALPDRNIYNSRTVKNILLTSYRYRKPVIAFSKNFVNAGALAALHSNTDQIAQSASHIVKQYFDAGSHFKQQVNHPENFDISINRQVFRALDLKAPDIKKIKNSLQHKAQDEAGKSL